MKGRPLTPTVDTIGPYRVDARLGGGGMGEVFKAYDARLDRWVAIKRLLPDRRESGQGRERFRREARAVARLNHPAIVHVYDIFQDGDRDCIVLELVEGERLDRILANGPLEPLAACRLAYTIAEGLGEAHAKGIVHRDLKAENVIVTASGRPKILDFGLAKPYPRDPNESSLTGEGHLVGTIRAMAPEQVRGETIDHRADLFSLGVLLYEMLTGDSPFAARSPVASLTQLMSLRPRAVREVAPAAPDDLSALIDRLLAKDPADRPSSADEVALDLRRIAGRIAAKSGDVAGTDAETGSTARPAPPRWTLRRRAAIAAVVALAALATAALLRREGRPRLELAARDLVVAADLVNSTGEPALAAPLATAFRVGLEQSPFVRVLSEAERREVLRRMERDPVDGVDRDLGLEICRREGAKALIVGTVVRAGSAYALSAAVVEPRRGTTVFTEHVRAADPAGLLEAVEHLAQGLRAGLGESLASIAEHDAPLERVTTGDLVALELYSLAVAKARVGDSDAALPLLLDAVARDPEFAMAHAELAQLYRRRSGATAAAERHLDLALRHAERLTEVERLYIEGWAATWRGPLEEVLRAWSLLTSLHPDESRGHHNLAMARWLYQNRFEDARIGFGAAAEGSAGDLRTLALGRRGYCEVALGRTDDAMATFAGLEESDTPWFRLGRVDALLAADRAGEADAEVARWAAAASTDVRQDAELRRAWLALDRGRFTAAAEVAGHLTRTASGAVALEGWIARVAALEQLGDRGALLAAVREATLEPRRILAEDPGRAYESPLPILALLGGVAARAGDLALARDLLADVHAGAAGSGYPIWEAQEALLAADIAAAESRLDEARRQLATSLERVDSFAAHRGLAGVLDAAGDARGALAEVEWLLDHRGRVVAERRDLGPGTGLDLVAWSLALGRQGRLADALGDPGTAARAYRALADRWRADERHPEREHAVARLAELAPEASAATGGD